MRVAKELSMDRPRLPDPTRRGGALFYAVAGGLIVAAVLVLLHHVHVGWS